MDGQHFPKENGVLSFALIVCSNPFLDVLRDGTATPGAVSTLTLAAGSSPVLLQKEHFKSVLLGETKEDLCVFVLWYTPHLSHALFQHAYD